MTKGRRWFAGTAAALGLVAVGLFANPAAEGDCRPTQGTWPLYGSPYASTNLGFCIYFANYWLEEPTCPADVRAQWTEVRNRALAAMWKPYSPTSNALPCQQAWLHTRTAREQATIANQQQGMVGGDPRPPLILCLEALDHLD
jgi:hypothetical protein